MPADWRRQCAKSNIWSAIWGKVDRTLPIAFWADLDRMLPSGAAGDHGKHMLDLAIVGGGPGGLMSAWYLKKKLGDLCRVTIYEASDRLGGKILTRKFELWRPRCTKPASPRSTITR